MQDKRNRINSLLQKRNDKKARKSPKFYKENSEGIKPILKFSAIKEISENINPESDELFYTVSNYERLNEHLDAESAVIDFAKIIAEGRSIAGTYLLQEVEAFDGEINFENVKKILEKSDERIKEYDDQEMEENHLWYSYRVADYNYSINEENESINISYLTCNGTSIEATLDFKKNSWVVKVDWNFTSVLRRIDATGFGHEYHTKFSDIMRPLHYKAREIFEKFANTSEFWKLYTIQYSFEQNEYEWTENSMEENSYTLDTPQANIAFQYNYFYGWYAEKLWILSREYHEAYMPLVITDESNMEEQIQKYFEKTDELARKKKILEIEESMQ